MYGRWLTEFLLEACLRYAGQHHILLKKKCRKRMTLQKHYRPNIKHSPLILNEVQFAEFNTSSVLDED